MVTVVEVVLRQSVGWCDPFKSIDIGSPGCAERGFFPPGLIADNGTRAGYASNDLRAAVPTDLVVLGDACP